MEDTQVHALDYLNVFRRRRWWLAGPVLASIVVGALLVKVLPKAYRSTATVGVQAPAVSPNIVNQPQSDNQERLRLLDQQLKGASILTRVAREEGLGSDSRAIGSLRSSIKVAVPDPVTATADPRRLDTFLISYDDGNPSRAQQITDRLVNVFIDETSKVRTEHAEDTSEFIAAQQHASEQRLNALGEQLQRAKEAHMGQLPEQTQANLQTLTGLRQQLEANSMALRSEQDRLTVIERQIDGMTKGSDVVLLPSGDHLSVQPEARVMLLEQQLADARRMYTDKHPEVVQLEAQLKAARADAAADKQKPEADRLAQLRLDPAYRQLQQDDTNAKMRVKQLQSADADLRRQINAYQSRVEAAPMVEAQLASLTRDYTNEQTQFNDLTAKLHAATIAESVEKDRQGEQFAVLEPASYPTAPTTPVPWRVMLISIAAGVCLGGGLTFAREYLDRSVHDVHELKNELDLPVLGEVTHIQTA